MRTIEPGEQLTYTFTATRSGVWMYHCHVQFHVDGGMVGLFLVRNSDGSIAEMWMFLGADPDTAAAFFG